MLACPECSDYPVAVGSYSAELSRNVSAIDLRTLLPLPDDELAKFDIGAVNLAFTAGLPGAEQIDVEKCLRTLDSYADCVRRWTVAAYEEFFLPNPGQFDHSEPTFRAMALVTALQKHCRVRYNPAKIDPQVPLDIHDRFIHGIIQGGGGTCASLPILYAAIGRRLGYPLKLVLAKRHVFVRWEGDTPTERINIEGSGEGMSVFPDEHYRTWPHRMTPEDERRFGYLLSLSPREEMALFAISRAYCWLEAGHYLNTVSGFIIADALCKGSRGYLDLAQMAADAWEERLFARMPMSFPQIEVLYDRSKRRWPSVPWEFEKRIGWLESVERVLNDPFLRETFWNPLAEGRLTKQELPRSLTADRTKEKLCSVPI